MSSGPQFPPHNAKAPHNSQLAVAPSFRLTMDNHVSLKQLTDGEGSITTHGRYGWVAFPTGGYEFICAQLQSVFFRTVGATYRYDFFRA